MKIRLGQGFKINPPFQSDNTPIHHVDLEEGVLGKANKNGTILVSDKITDPKERQSVIEHEKVNCIFSEPQFNPSIIKSIAKDTKVKTGILDPLGAKLDKGKNLYFDLLNDMASSFKGF